MPRYMSLFRYTGEAWSRMVERPGDRSEAARRLIEGAGGRMEGFYWMLGDWDGFVVYEVPDAAIAFALSARVAGSGLLGTVTTHELVGVEQALSALDTTHAAASAWAPPGAQDDWREGYDQLG